MPRGLSACTKALELYYDDDDDQFRNLFYNENIERLPRLIGLNPIEKKDDGVRVWEIKRPPLTGLSQTLMNDGDITEEELRLLQLDELTDFFEREPRLINWAKQLETSTLKQLYDKVHEDLVNANGWVAESNPILSLCTGSHNNTVFLGSREQGTGAMFYISPYMLKSKVNIQQALGVLLAAGDHCKKNPSKAEDAGTKKRDIQYVLTRTLNQLNLKMELSDYQVAASLLDLPSEFTSHAFSYVGQDAYLAFIANDLKKEAKEKAEDSQFANVNAKLDEQERNKDPTEFSQFYC